MHNYFTANQMTIQFSKLSSLCKELTKSTSLLNALLSEFETIVDIFKYIFANIDGGLVPFYFTEYCVKVATILDVIETLEFGRLRSSHLTNLHSRHISLDKVGGFMIQPRPFEKDLKLTTCSHEGLAYLFNAFEVHSSVTIVKRFHNYYFSA